MTVVGIPTMWYGAGNEDRCRMPHRLPQSPVSVCLEYGYLSTRHGILAQCAGVMNSAPLAFVREL